MADNESVSHGDIYHKLGTMEGKLESIIIQLGEKNTDVNNLFTRLNAVENKVALVMGAAAIMSVLVPLLITALGPKIHLPATQYGVEHSQQN